MDTRKTPPVAHDSVGHLEAVENLRTEVRRQVAGGEITSLISITLDIRWAIWYACQGINQHKRKRAVIFEILMTDLTEPIISLCSESSCQHNGLSGTLLTSAVSASELCVYELCESAFTGKSWVIDPRTDIGKFAIDLKGGDEYIDINGEQVYGTYHRWLHDEGGFHSRFHTDAKERGFLKKIELTPAREEGPLTRGQRKRVRTPKARSGFH